MAVNYLKHVDIHLDACSEVSVLNSERVSELFEPRRINDKLYYIAKDTLKFRRTKLILDRLKLKYPYEIRNKKYLSLTFCKNFLGVIIRLEEEWRYFEYDLRT